MRGVRQGLIQLRHDVAWAPLADRRLLCGPDSTAPVMNGGSMAGGFLFLLICVGRAHGPSQMLLTSKRNCLGPPSRG